jgi:hypothetical protein
LACRIEGRGRAAAAAAALSRLAKITIFISKIFIRKLAILA